MDQPALHGRLARTYGRLARTYVCTNLILVVSLALQAAGLATPGWCVLNYGTRYYVTQHVGLWVARNCFNNDCDEDYRTRHYFRSDCSFQMHEYQVETCIALGLLLFSIVLYGCCRFKVYCTTRHLKACVYFIVFSTFSSGVLAVMAACQFGVKISKLSRYFSIYERDLNENNRNPVQIPYSLFLTGIGGLIAGVLSLGILFYLNLCKSESVPPDAYEISEQPDVIVYSGQPQPGIVHQAPPSYTYADYPGQLQPENMHQGPPSYTYAMSQQQSPIPHAGQPSDRTTDICEGSN